MTRNRLIRSAKKTAVLVEYREAAEENQQELDWKTAWCLEQRNGDDRWCLGAKGFRAHVTSR